MRRLLSKGFESFIHSNICKVLNQEIYSEPSHGDTNRQPVKHTFIILRQEANFQWESIPCRGTNKRRMLGSRSGCHVYGTLGKSFTRMHRKDLRDHLKQVS